jgi:hypothetical protein
MAMIRQGRVKDGNQILCISRQICRARMEHGRALYAAAAAGRRRKTSLQAVMDAIFHLLQSGFQWHCGRIIGLAD